MSRRPPIRRCPDCGGDYAAWHEGAPHRGCPNSLKAENASELRTMLREAREARRARYADGDMAGGRNTLTRFADADLATPGTGELVDDGIPY